MATPPFETATARNIGQTTTSVVTANTTQYLTIIGLTLSNISGGAISANVVYNDGSNDTSIVANVPIPYGSSLVPIGGDQKIVLTPSDSLKVTANTATSMDVVVSYLNQAAT
jgi:hypothetical protein